MEKVSSDSELSTDSLEDLSTRLSKINPHAKETPCLTSTTSGNSYKTLSNEETLENKTPTDTQIALNRSSVKSHSNDNDKWNVSSKGSDIYNSGSYFFSDNARSQSARIPSRPTQRISRRQSLGCFETSESQRIRHRSVSYLEQFKRKNGGTNDIGLTTLTTLPSEVMSMSSSSSITITSVNKTFTSEFEFCEELPISKDSTVSNRTRKENNPKCKVIPVDRKVESERKKVRCRQTVFFVKISFIIMMVYHVKYNVIFYHIVVVFSKH